MWYEFNTLEEFNEWHAEICQSLGIPNAQTNAYTEVFEVEDKWIAVVQDSESAGLNLTELRIQTFNPDRALV